MQVQNRVRLGRAEDSTQAAPQVGVSAGSLAPVVGQTPDPRGGGATEGDMRWSYTKIRWSGDRPIAVRRQSLSRRSASVQSGHRVVVARRRVPSASTRTVTNGGEGARHCRLGLSDRLAVLYRLACRLTKSTSCLVVVPAAASPRGYSLWSCRNISSRAEMGEHRRGCGTYLRNPLRVRTHRHVGTCINYFPSRRLSGELRRA